MNDKPETSVTLKGNESDDFCKRMDEAVSLAGGVTKVSKMADVSISALRKWRQGLAEPNRVNLINVASAAGLNVGWLATGEGPKMKGELPTAISFKQIEDLDTVALIESCIVIREAEEALGLSLNGKQFASVLYHAYNYSAEQEYALPDDVTRVIVQGASKDNKTYGDDEVRRRPYGQTKHYKSDEI